jgi:hypothetical protein
VKTLLALLVLFTAMTLTATSARAADAPYRHIVLFKFKDDAPRADVEKVEKAFAALKEKTGGIIQDFEWGLNCSPETHDQGFTHCYFVTFKSKADLEKYLPHPEHKAFGALLGPVLDKVLVVDYVARK